MKIKIDNQNELEENLKEIKNIISNLENRDFKEQELKEESLEECLKIRDEIRKLNSLLCWSTIRIKIIGSDGAEPKSFIV